MSTKLYLLVMSCSMMLPMQSYAITTSSRTSICPIDTTSIHLLKEVTVRSGRLVQVLPSTKIKGLLIEKIKSPTLGETLGHIPGIQNLSYGAHLGTPMIRSLTGNRVKILYDGVGINDLSGISPDIALDIPMDEITQMEVFKESASVLYGGKAIGGAVNLSSSLVPFARGRHDLNLVVDLSGGYNTTTKQYVNALWNTGKHAVFRLSLYDQYQDKVRIPGFPKASIAYDKDKLKNDRNLQTLTQVNLEMESIFNTTLLPYIYPEDYSNEMGLSLSERYTNQKDRYDESSPTWRSPNLKNPEYVPGQDPTKDRYRDIVKGIKDYGPVQNGYLPNSHFKSRGGSLGVGFIYPELRYGIAYQTSFINSGIPGYSIWESEMKKIKHGDHYHTVPGKIEYLPINTQSQSHRILTQGVYLPSDNAFLKSLKASYIFERLTDSELLDDREANTLNSTHHSFRLEGSHKALALLTGLFGVDMDYRKIITKGHYRYLPNNKSSDFGAFISEQLRLPIGKHSSLTLKGGYRWDYTTRHGIVDSTYIPSRSQGTHLASRYFYLNNYNLGLAFATFNDHLILRGGFAHSERAPEVNELYAGNRHFALVIEENGQQRLKKERMTSYTLGADVKIGPLSLNMSYYDRVFRDYIYLDFTGISRNGMNVRAWRASDTRITGFELSGQYDYKSNMIGQLSLSAFMDHVINKDISGDEHRLHYDGKYMPNLPTSRWGAGLDWNKGPLFASLTLEHYLQQKYRGRYNGFEFKLPDYTLLNGRLSYKTKLQGIGTEYYIYGKNLLNQEARPFNSILKYIAPLPGIAVGVGLKLTI